MPIDVDSWVAIFLSKKLLDIDLTIPEAEEIYKMRKKLLQISILPSWTTKLPNFKKQLQEVKDFREKKLKQYKEILTKKLNIDEENAEKIHTLANAFFDTLMIASTLRYVQFLILLTAGPQL